MSDAQGGLSYAAAGVDIDAAATAMKGVAALVRSTATADTLSELGSMAQCLGAALRIALGLGALEPGQLHCRVGDEGHRREQDRSGHAQAQDRQLPPDERLQHGA